MQDAATKFSVVHHISRFADAFQNGGCLWAAEIIKAGLGQQGLQRIPIAGLQALADGGGADGLAVSLFAGHHDAVDARFGELLAHDLVIQACHLAGRLFAHIAGRDVQGFGDFGKHCKVEPGMAVNDRSFIFQKVAGEGGIGDDVGAAVVQHDVGQVLHALCHQALAHRKGHKAGILADHEQMQCVAGGSGFFHKIRTPVPATRLKQGICIIWC